MGLTCRRSHNSTRTYLILVFAVCVVALSGANVQCGSPPGGGEAGQASSLLPLPSPPGILSHLKYLASDKLEGRATGERGGELAADYIQRQFKKLGLLPPGGGYLQHFDATVGVSLGKRNSVTILFPDGESTYVCGTDFIPFSFSAVGSASAPIEFAGYGITSEQYGYDDYDNENLDGRVALVMRHEPQELDESSVFEGKVLTHYSDLRYKATNARDHGAVAVMVTTDPVNHSLEEDELMRLQSREGLGDCGLLAIQVKERIAQAILESQGLELEELQAEIDSTLTPERRILSSVRASLEVDLVKEKRNVANVIGILTPRNRSVSEYVVVGAHYDHLGRGGESSLSKGGGIHNGADDNASGVSAMLELARMFSAKRDSLKRGIVFVGFTGEEIGVLGSTFYVNNPPVPLEKTALMLNLDTVGRMREQKLYAAGVGSSPVLKGLIERANAELSLTIETSEGGYGPSDHFAFYGRNVPVLFLFTGAHEDYHKTSDDWQKVNLEGVASIVRLSSLILGELVFAETPVPFTRAVAEKAGPPGGEGYGRGSGAYFGIVPDFGGRPDEGARISGVSEGSPAEVAGLKAGDIIIRFGNKDITSLYDLSYALREKKSGDEVTVVVLRGGREISFQATLSRRAQE